MQKRNNKVFLDANVFIAAVLSPTGGSARLISEASQQGFQLFSSKYAITESIKNIADKYPDHLFNCKNLFLEHPITITPEPSKPFIQRSTLLIDIKDVPILASAIENKMDFLVTLDKEHFITPNIPKTKTKLDILTPGDFIKTNF